MKLKSGIKILEKSEGQGTKAEKGDKVVYNMRLYLNKGEEVDLNRNLAENMPDHLSYMVRTVGDQKFINHHTTLGKRESIAAVEHSLIGMRIGGYRKIKASPHMAYGEKGLPGLIPENAVLTIELWLREII